MSDGHAPPHNSVECGIIGVEVAPELVGVQEAGAGQAMQGVEILRIEAGTFSWIHGWILVRVDNGLRGLYRKLKMVG